MGNMLAEHVVWAIERNLDRPLTLAELAKSVSQTPLQFLREFTCAVGMTPHAFITETRLQASRHRLAHSDTPIAMIAVECGFSHQSHMGTAFRRTLGMTPSQYRRIYQGRTNPLQASGATLT